MTAADLLVSLRQEASVSLAVTPEGRLRYTAAERDLTPDELALLRQHRDELIALLRDEAMAQERDAAVQILPWRLDAATGTELAAKGWRQPGPLGWCETCNGPTVWVDRVGRARHPWCPARPGRAA